MVPNELQVELDRARKLLSLNSTANDAFTLRLLIILAQSFLRLNSDKLVLLSSKSLSVKAEEDVL